MNPDDNDKKFCFRCAFSNTDHAHKPPQEKELNLKCILGGDFISDKVWCYNLHPDHKCSYLKPASPAEVCPHGADNKDCPVGCSPTDKPQEKVNFLQVGRTIECGGCFPKKYNVHIIPCVCICHDGISDLPTPAKTQEFNVDNYYGFEELMNEWIKQGRSPMFVAAVKNFLTGIGGIKLRKEIAAAYDKGYDARGVREAESKDTIRKFYEEKLEKVRAEAELRENEKWAIDAVIREDKAYERGKEKTLQRISDWAGEKKRKCDSWSGCGLSEFNIKTDISCGAAPFSHMIIVALNQALSDLQDFIKESRE